MACGFLIIFIKPLSLSAYVLVFLRRSLLFTSKSKGWHLSENTAVSYHVAKSSCICTYFSSFSRATIDELSLLYTTSGLLIFLGTVLHQLSFLAFGSLTSPSDMFLFSNINTCSLICSAFRGLSQIWTPIASFICSLYQLQLLRWSFLPSLSPLSSISLAHWTKAHLMNIPSHHYHHALKVLLASLLSNAAGNF